MTVLTILPLPNETLFEFYEGSDPELFTDLTGNNLNKAVLQLKANLDYLRDQLTSLILGATVYSPVVNYAAAVMVKETEDSKFCYLSLAVNNYGNPLSDTTKWLPIKLNIDDDTTGPNTTWSSQKVTSFVNDRAEDEGILNAIVFGG